MVWIVCSGRSIGGLVVEDSGRSTNGNSMSHKKEKNYHLNTATEQIPIIVIIIQAPTCGRRASPYCQGNKTLILSYPAL
jgi:hypothetical protein